MREAVRKVGTYLLRLAAPHSVRATLLSGYDNLSGGIPPPHPTSKETTMRRTSLIALSALLLTVSSAAADDWPQWMGPQRDSVWRETGVIEKIPEDGLPVKWRAPVQWGYAGPAVAGGKVFVTDYVIESGEVANSPGGRTRTEGQERILCLDAETGEEIWTHAYDETYNLSYAGGPRVTPTVDGQHVYTLGAEGRLICLNVDDGAVVWEKNLKQEYNTDSPFWGYSAAPLIDGNRLFCIVGGEGSVAVAFDKHSGEELWRALSAEEPGYCPPTMIDAGGTQQLVIWDPEHISGLDPATGDVHWSLDLRPNYKMSVTAPRQAGDHLFASGIGNVSAMLALGDDSPTAEVAWRGPGARSLYCSNSTPFIEDGVIYGNGCSRGELQAIDAANGETLWLTFDATTGNRPAPHATVFLVKHEDRFFLFNDQGDLILAELSREGYNELGRFHVLDPTNEGLGREVVWSHPAFANRCLYARNDKELVCVSLAAD